MNGSPSTTLIKHNKADSYINNSCSHDIALVAKELHKYKAKKSKIAKKLEKGSAT